MSSYEHNNIKLKEAMTMDLTQSIRVWSVPGLHIKIENIPENAIINKTLVMMTSSGKWVIGLELNVEGHTGDYITNIAEFSSLQELFDNLPEFTKLEGDLFALC